MNRDKPKRTPPPNEFAAADVADPLKEYRMSIVMPPGHQGTVFQLKSWDIEHRGVIGNHILRGVTVKGERPVFAVGDVEHESERDHAARADGEYRPGLAFTLRRVWVDGHRIV